MIVSGNAHELCMCRKRDNVTNNFCCIVIKLSDSLSGMKKHFITVFNDCKYKKLFSVLMILCYDFLISFCSRYEGILMNYINYLS